MEIVFKISKINITFTGRQDDDGQFAERAFKKEAFHLYFQMRSKVVEFYIVHYGRSISLGSPYT